MNRGTHLFEHYKMAISFCALHFHYQLYPYRSSSSTSRRVLRPFRAIAASDSFFGKFPSVNATYFTIAEDAAAIGTNDDIWVISDVKPRCCCVAMVLVMQLSPLLTFMRL